MKILFVWTGVTSYMADCWRRLQQEEGIELKIVVELAEIGKEFDREKVLRGLDACVVSGAGNGPRSCFFISGRGITRGEAELAKQVARGVTASTFWADIAGFLGGWKPEVMFAVGWHSKVVREMVGRKDWRDVPKVCCFDMPWRRNLRCFAARWVLGPFLGNYCAVFVPGKSTARYAQWLGFRDVTEGLYAIDVERFKGSASRAESPSKRSGFLFVGRKVPEKGLDFLKKGYEVYRRTGGTWTLDVPKWIDPEDVPRVMSEHACLILPSRWEPWGVVVAEAKAAGMAVIVSDRVGARLDLPVDAAVRFGDVKGLAAAMRQIEQQGAVSADECSRAVERFGCAAWADTVGRIVERVRGKRE